MYIHSFFPPKGQTLCYIPEQKTFGLHDATGEVMCVLGPLTILGDCYWGRRVQCEGGRDLFKQNSDPELWVVFSWRSAQTTSSAFSSAPKGISHSISCTLASCQIPQTYSFERNTLPLNSTQKSHVGLEN